LFESAFGFDVSHCLSVIADVRQKLFEKYSQEIVRLKWAVTGFELCRYLAQLKHVFNVAAHCGASILSH
jgi:hypothetical protein